MVQKEKRRNEKLDEEKIKENKRIEMVSRRISQNKRRNDERKFDFITHMHLQSTNSPGLGSGSNCGIFYFPLAPTPLNY